MSEFLACTFAALVVLMAIGMFKPSVALPRFLAFRFLPSFALNRIRKATDSPSRLRVIGWYTAAIVLNFIVGGLYLAGTKEAPVVENPPASKQEQRDSKSPSTEPKFRKVTADGFTLEQFARPCAGAGMLLIDTVIQKEQGGPIEPLLDKADRFARSFPEVEKEIRPYYHGFIKATYNEDHSDLYKKIGGDPKSGAAMALKVRLGEVCLKAQGF